MYLGAAHVAAYRAVGLRAGVFLLTNDRGLCMRAEANGVKSFTAMELPASVESVVRAVPPVQPAEMGAAAAEMLQQQQQLVMLQSSVASPAAVPAIPALHNPHMPLSQHAIAPEQASHRRPPAAPAHPWHADGPAPRSSPGHRDTPMDAQQALQLLLRSTTSNAADYSAQNNALLSQPGHYSAQNNALLSQPGLPGHRGLQEARTRLDDPPPSASYSAAELADELACLVATALTPVVKYHRQQDLGDLWEEMLEEELRPPWSGAAAVRVINNHSTSFWWVAVGGGLMVLEFYLFPSHL
jgi:hypothetical protein